jgi:catechol 2,3-dioxygenase-like lactoylglutathione lyase family enzyme
VGAFRETSVVLRSFHVRLIVADFDGCFRFYRDLLGLRVTWGEDADGSAMGYVSFEIPDGSLSINDQRIFAPVVGIETREPGETAKDRARRPGGDESLDAVEGTCYANSRRAAETSRDLSSRVEIRRSPATV